MDDDTIGCIEALLQHGANPNIAVMMEAVQLAALFVFSRLMILHPENGGCVNARMKDGLTSLNF